MSTALVIDGQETDRQFFASLLGCFNYGVWLAEDGIVGAAMLQRRVPDVILVEVLNGTLDGYEFVARLRAHRATAKTPVLLLAPGCYAEQATHAAREFPHCGILTKPQAPDSIVTQVNAALRRNAPHDFAGRLAKFERQYVSAPADPVDPKARVFLVDDDPTIRNLVSTLARSAGLPVEVFPSAEAFLDQHADTPGCLLLDLDLPDRSGIEVLEILRARESTMPTIVLTAMGCLSSAQRALRLHTLDFLEKSVPPRTLLARIFLALQTDSIQRRKLFRKKKVSTQLAALTARERELLDLIVEGLGSKQIAHKLSISIKTVSNHRAHLLSKTGAQNVADLVRMSMIVGDARMAN